jgi:DNA-binding SARP family transcriptional activator
MHSEPMTTIKGLVAKARHAEEDSNIDIAVQQYQEVIKIDPLNEQAYNRLMILYRKMKDYKKELSVIDKGIKAFEKLYKPKATGRMKKVAEISLKMAKSVGLLDKKGAAVYEPEPIGKWKKRKLLVEKKIK